MENDNGEYEAPENNISGSHNPHDAKKMATLSIENGLMVIGAINDNEKTIFSINKMNKDN